MSIRYGTLVWCAGIKPHPFVSDFGFAMNDKGSQILVDEFLKVKDESGIYAIGDCATIDNYWLPQTAQVANQQGQYLAKALSMDEAKIKPFEFHNKVSIFMGEVRTPFGASPNTCWLLQHLLDAIQRIFATHCFSSSFDGRSKVLIDGYGWSSTKVCQNHVPSIHRMIHSRISAMNFSFKKSCPYFLGPPTSSFENPGGRAPWHTWVAWQQSWPTCRVWAKLPASWPSWVGVSPIGFYNSQWEIASCLVQTGCATWWWYFWWVFCRFFFFLGGGSEVFAGRRLLEDFLPDLESIKGFRRIMNFLVQIKMTRHFCIYNIPYHIYTQYISYEYMNNTL